MMIGDDDPPRSYEKVGIIKFGIHGDTSTDASTTKEIISI